MITTSPSAPVKSRDMSAAWRHVDLLLIIFVGLTCLLGSAMVYSASRSKASLDGLLDKHIMFLMIGVATCAVVASINYEKLRALSPLAYLATLAMLVGVLFFAREIKGIKAWFEVGPIQIQPAELAKVVVILLIGTYLGSVEGPLRLRHLVTSLV
ncbi:MAG: FtsW/RodA/SpoVE family cell cycle protein, partial [Actinobacteria bacterium]|nr:FtsW/RodA/SpoVE family cell cycle protein [Actinomycetota bacterium]